MEKVYSIVPDESEGMGESVGELMITKKNSFKHAT